MKATSKVYVLVHGAWHGGWCWRQVTQILAGKGNVVYTPTNTGLGERQHLLSNNITLNTFVDDISNLLYFEDLHNVVLVGHSFGGLAISGVADRCPERIQQLVYLDAFILQNGQSTMGTLPDGVANKLRQQSNDFDGGLSLPIPSPKSFGVTQPDQVQLLEQYCTPQPLSVYESTLQLQHSIGNGLPVTYVAADPGYAPTAASRVFAQQQTKWKYITVNAGHNLPVCHPDLVAELLL